MPNDLTGDFDVVAQFAVPAANRVLAAMHWVERFPHSVAIRVDDVEPVEPGVFQPATVAAVDRFGDPLADHERIRDLVLPSTMSLSGRAMHFPLDPVVNVGNAGVLEIPTEPSNLQGRAQLQLFPPTIDVTDGSGTNVTVCIQLLARYFPDPGTSPMAEFVRGELRITAPVSQVSSQVANVVEIDIKAANIIVNFVPEWSSKPIGAEDMAAINLLIRNTLRTSFLPSNSRLPANINHVQFRTLQGAVDAIALLIDLDGGPSDRNSAGTVFLGGGDDFAFAVGSDFVRAAFQPAIDRILSATIEPVSFTIETLVKTWNITYTVVLNDASFELRAGEMVLTIRGRATTPSWPPNFNFTVQQRFSLEANGATADLLIGDIALDTSSWIVDRFRGRATTAIAKVRDLAIAESGARETIRRMLSADANLGGFLDSLVDPPRPVPGQRPVRIGLHYTGIDIRPAGIVLHGSLATIGWASAHVEFEQLPSGNTGPLGGATGVLSEPEFSALKTWIQGGTVTRYEWRRQGQPQAGLTEHNKFVYRRPLPPASAETSVAAPVSGYVPLCLTVHGTRLSSSGPVVDEPIWATVCGVNSFAILDSAYDGALPFVALAEPDPRGMVRVTGHTAARKARAGEPNPNLIVHFADAASAANLEALIVALRGSRRVDAPTAIIAVIAPNDLANARYVDGVTYTADSDGAWQRRFGMKNLRRPMTMVIEPGGDVVAEHEGEVDGDTLSAVLRESLVAGRPVASSIEAGTLRIGQRPPNFLFEYSPGREVTLRKITGRPVHVVFWRAFSSESIEMVRDLSAANGTSGAPLVLAVNDGDEADVATKAAADNRLTAVVVTDTAGSIARAYGVETWPTTVSIDSFGLVRTVRSGRENGDANASRLEQQSERSTAP
ncbi:MAG: TlpA family protein disulfide reductase [Gemmatimonadaceae bacterium]|nr:TlpA family protein disulfide reductase [Gemmatimonadaceae bacterium]